MTFRPILPLPDYPPLDWRPDILKPAGTISLMILFLIIGAGLVILVYFAGADDQFNLRNDYLRLTARYIPSIIGVITMILFRSFISELLRMLPYMAMADQKDLTKGASAGQSIARVYFPWQPMRTHNGPLVVFANLTRNYSSFLVAFKVALLSTRNEGNNKYSLVVRPPIAWLLVGGYFLMSLFTLVVTVRLWSVKSGLKWDPVSIADRMALFRHSNIDFEELERKPDGLAAKSKTLEGRYRLGCWSIECSDCKPRFCYGIREISHKRYTHLLRAREARDSPEFGRVQIEEFHGEGDSHAIARSPVTREPAKNDHKCGSACGHSAGTSLRDARMNAEKDQCATVLSHVFISCSTQCPCAKPTRCHHYPYRHSPGVGTGIWTFWTILVVGSTLLCIYILTRNLVDNGFYIANTWVPGSSTNTSMTANQTLHPDDYYTLVPGIDQDDDLILYAIVFRTIPTLFASWFGMGHLLTVDNHHRFLQPFVDMYQTPGSASDTILLEYFTRSSLIVPLIAWGKSHYKVFWFSFLATVSSAFPILVGGLFTIVNTGARVWFFFSPDAFWTVFVFLVVYCISLPFARPTTKRYLPRQYYSLADIMAMCHRSHIFDGPDLDISPSWSTQEYMAACILVRRDKYLLGRYIGTDGKLHLGFDAAEWNGEPNGNMAWLQPIGRKDRSGGWFRRRRGYKKQGNDEEDHELDTVNVGPDKFRPSSPGVGHEEQVRRRDGILDTAWKMGVINV